MLAYPAITRLLGFDDVHAGIFIGATIHDVAQVVGAGFAISPETGNTATIVKLASGRNAAPRDPFRRSDELGPPWPKARNGRHWFRGSLRFSRLLS